MGKITFQGRGIEVTEAMRNYADKKLRKLLGMIREPVREKIDTSFIFSIEKFRKKVIATLKVRNRSGIVLNAEEEDVNFYTALDMAIKSLGKQVRRLKVKKIAKRKAGKTKVTIRGEPEESLVEAENLEIDKPKTIEDALVEIGTKKILPFLDVDGTLKILYKKGGSKFGLILTGCRP